MRISDWSSDVCSSDLLPSAVATGTGQTRMDRAAVRAVGSRRLPRRAQRRKHVINRHARAVVGIDGACMDDPIGADDEGDRKSGVEGKRLSVRVELGGRRIIKKKKKI